MFLALREIRSAAGRFVMIGAVTALITLLLVMLTGLTQGLGSRNTSGLESLDAGAVVFVDPYSPTPEVSFTNSVISADALTSLNHAADVVPLGVGQTRAEGGGGATAVGVFGLPDGETFNGITITDQAAISQDVADALGVTAGSTMTVGGTTVTVGEVVPNEYYSHSPVIWVDTASWQQITHTDAVGTVGVVKDSVTSEQKDALSHNAAVVSTKDAFAGLPAYQSERSSLVSMQGFLYAISALVTISFLSVWTMQRTRDISVLRCLGASTGYVFKDALVQAAIILGIGSLVGAGVGTALGALIAQSPVPFLLTASTVALPAAGVFALGILGSVLAVRRVQKVDPLIALSATA